MLNFSGFEFPVLIALLGIIDLEKMGLNMKNQL